MLAGPRQVSAWVVLFALLAAAGCSRDPLPEAVAHLDAVVALLERHAQAPAAAARAVHGYAKAHEAELRALSARLAALKGSLRSDAAQLAEARWRLVPVQARLTVLWQQRPALIESPEVQAALRALRFE